MKLKDIINYFRKKNNESNKENSQNKTGEKFSNIKIEEKIVSGDRKNGVLERYQNGKIISRIPYCDGKMDGRVYTYYEDGTIESVQDYKYGELNGISIIYDRRGNVVYDSEYKGGNLVGRNNFNNYNDFEETYDRDF